MVKTSEIPDSIKQHVPEHYHDFADVFSKVSADILAPHRSYDLKINLEDGTRHHSVPSIPSQSPSFSHSEIFSMNTSKKDSSTHHALHMEHQCYSCGKRTAPYDSA